jgi:hypothetical protein
VNSILIIAFNIFLIIFINNIFLKKNFLIDKKQLDHKSFTSKEAVPISGGFLIIVNVLFFNNNYLANIFFFGIFCLGVFSDLLIIKNPIARAILLMITMLTKEMATD